MNSCQNRVELVEFLQNFIYSMNDEKRRDKIMQEYCSKCNNVFWIGTFYVMGDKYKLTTSDGIPFHQILSKHVKIPKKNEKICFTVCYQYEGNKVHYVSFCFMKNTLIHFDPGVSLYEHGQKTLAPSVRKIFQQKKWTQNSKELGICKSFKFKGKKMGVQFNNLNPYFPADAFCQTWTIFFFKTMCDSSKKSFSFVTEWCNTKPEKREILLIREFIFPLLKKKPSLVKLIKSQCSNQSIPHMRTLKKVITEC